MSSLKTNEYKLHKWEDDDNVSRVEFNENFDKMDTKLKEVCDKSNDIYEKTDTLKTQIINQNKNIKGLSEDINKNIFGVNQNLNTYKNNIEKKVLNNKIELKEKIDNNNNLIKKVENDCKQISKRVVNQQNDINDLVKKVKVKSPADNLTQAEINNLKRGRLLDGTEVNVTRIRPKIEINKKLKPNECYTHSVNIFNKDAKFFNVLINAGKINGKRTYLPFLTSVHIKGKSGYMSGYHICTGSLSVEPSNNVTERYMSCGTWYCEGVDKHTVDKANNATPIIGMAHDSDCRSPIIRGGGMYRNKAFGVLTHNEVCGHMMELLGIYLEDGEMHLRFRNRSSVELELSTRIFIEVW